MGKSKRKSKSKRKNKSQSKEPTPEFIDISPQEAEELRERIRKKSLTPQDYQLLEGLINAFFWLLHLLDESKSSLKRVLRLFWKKSEKSKDILKKEDNTDTNNNNQNSEEEKEKAEEKADIAAKDKDNVDNASDNDDGNDGNGNGANGAGQERQGQKGEKPKPPGHGKNGAASYVGSEIIPVPVEGLKAGDVCPECEKGKLYEWRPKGGKVLRITGESPIKARIYHLQKLRCALCAKIYSAQLPDEAGDKKYDAESGAMLAVLKYGTGMPFYRLQSLQDNHGIPLPASTQWEVVRDVSIKVFPVYYQLLMEAAQGEVIHNDDTTVKILELMEENQNQAKTGKNNPSDRNERKGMFTTGIVSKIKGYQIALYFSGREHAGENLKLLLKNRLSSLPPPIQMCDALSRNTSDEFETILANCLAHGRRNFVDTLDVFPGESRHVIEQLGEVYRNDAIAKAQEMTPGQRLEFHQEKSGPIMDKLKEWFERQFKEKKVEPNSSLGKAINYMNRHWDKLTLFLRVEGAPLDNNAVERSLKMAILNRKNAYFYKTLNGAHTGDIFMSIIQTCKLARINAFEYLTELQKHSKDVGANPSEWLPWNYKSTMAEKSLD
jgi:hypothetical protein